MISEEAKKFLDKKSAVIVHPVSGKMIYYQISRYDAERAVEIAEADLLTFNNSKDQLPNPDVEVLVKIDAPLNKYDIMKHNEHGWWQKAPGGGWCAPNHDPIGWRYIHEIE